MTLLHRLYNKIALHCAQHHFTLIIVVAAIILFDLSVALPNSYSDYTNHTKYPNATRLPPRTSQHLKMLLSNKRISKSKANQLSTTPPNSPIVIPLDKGSQIGNLKLRRSDDSYTYNTIHPPGTFLYNHIQSYLNQNYSELMGDSKFAEIVEYVEDDPKQSLWTPPAPRSTKRTTSIPRTTKATTISSTTKTSVSAPTTTSTLAPTPTPDLTSTPASISTLVSTPTSTTVPNVATSTSTLSTTTVQSIKSTNTTLQSEQEAKIEYVTNSTGYNGASSGKVSTLLRSSLLIFLILYLL